MASEAADRNKRIAKNTLYLMEKNKSKCIELCKEGHDPFVDFLKGFCILSVILHHCLGPKKDLLLFPYWGQLAVPLFLTLQAYHVFRRDYRPIDRAQVIKVLRRIVLPFAVFTALEFILYAFLRDYSLVDLIKRTILQGGIGPGSYYCWIYLQFFVLVPIVYWLFLRFNISLHRWG